MKADLKQKIYNFNGYNRDQWVARMAQTVPAGADVLDAGAGTGIYRHLFAHCNYKSQDFCKVPSTEGRYIEMDYICDITQIPVPDQSFDVILCTEVLEHVPEPIKVVREFARILRSGGRLLITAPQGSGIHQEPYIYYGGYTPFWYERFLGEHGFEDIRVEANGGFFRLYGQESRRFVKLLFSFEKNIWMKIIDFPFKLLLTLWHRKFIPLLCYWADGLDTQKQFTVGYFVEAVKGPSGSRDDEIQGLSGGTHA